MRRVFPILICLLLFMSSCRPSPSELTSTAKIAMQKITKTPTLTQTPTLTLTPTPTSTLIPTAIPTPLGGGGIIAFVQREGNKGRIGLYQISTRDFSYPTIQFTQVVDEVYGVSSVSVSPDGTKLAFTQSMCPTRKPGQQYAYCTGDIFISNIDGTNVIQLTKNNVDEAWPVWSPDGTKIAYVSAPSDFGKIYVINVDGSGKTRLTSGLGRDFLPTWSPDGKKIAFQSSRNGNFQIFVMNVDRSGGAVQLTKNSGIISGNPSWSPDGSKIAFFGYSLKTKTGDIYIMDADGSNPTNLTAGGRYIGMIPKWSPDGKAIASICDGLLCMMSPEGTLVFMLSFPIGVEDISWSMP